jgi:hypothetical protein
MKTKCCNQKIESDERFCSDCGWEAKVRDEWVQMEFSFVGQVEAINELYPKQLLKMKLAKIFDTIDLLALANQWNKEEMLYGGLFSNIHFPQGQLKLPLT